MKPAVERLLDRRSFFASMGSAAAGASAFRQLTDADLEAAPQNVQRNSIPSQLKITDMRIATVVGAPAPTSGARRNRRRRSPHRNLAYVVAPLVGPAWVQGRDPLTLDG